MKDVAIVLGGSETVFAEFEAALALCTGLTVENLCCNDMIANFPGVIDHAVTLHPPKMTQWLATRLRAGYPGLGRVWGHRMFDGATDFSNDWGGSVGLLAIKIARELGHRKIILAGVPMDVVAGHFVRHRNWNAAHGFRPHWNRHVRHLRPFVRSMSGWTKELFCAPTWEWLRSEIPDPNPMLPDRGLKA